MDKINLESSTDSGSRFERYPYNWSLFAKNQSIGATGTSTGFGDEYESSFTVTEIDENYLNYKRIEELQKQFTKEFIRLLKDDDFEYGFDSKADIFVREKIQINALATKSWLNHIFIEYFKDTTILIGILRVISRLEYYQIYPEGQTMALAALSHDNEEVQECGIRAYENWEVLDSLKVLESIKVNSGWLQDYVNSVVNSLRKKFNA